MNSRVQTATTTNELDSSNSSAEPSDSSLIDSFMFGLTNPGNALAHVQQLAAASTSNSLKRKPDLTNSFLNSLSTKQARKETVAPATPNNFRFLPQDDFVQLSIDQKLNAIYSALRDMSQTKAATMQNTQSPNPSLSLEFHTRKNDFTKWIKIWFSRLRTPVYLKSEASIKKEILQSGIFSGQELAPTNNTRFQKELVTHFQLKLNENRGNARKKVLGLKEYKKYLNCTTKALAEFIFSDVPITEEQLKKAALMVGPSSGETIVI
ncbi:hypothetical protein K7432_004728 [Basidiobolus ranarum]|uniref:Uncharacterized protein n=1 Tax=Basidiobolus ranarum TaxID=34480 RepID=A0ABR2WXN5_9FUNG